MSRTIQGTRTFKVADFDPVALAPLVGAKVYVEVHAETANGNMVLTRTAAGVIAGAERWQGLEGETSTTANYWPRIHFEHGFSVTFSLDHPASEVTVNIV